MRSLTKSQAKLAVYRQIKECKVAPHVCDLEPNANGPNVLWLDNPLFQGRGWSRPTKRACMADPPPTRPPRRSMASAI
jgi:hypothetical protein